VGPEEGKGRKGGNYSFFSFQERKSKRFAMKMRKEKEEGSPHSLPLLFLQEWEVKLASDAKRRRKRREETFLLPPRKGGGKHDTSTLQEKKALSKSILLLRERTGKAGCVFLVFPAAGEKKGLQATKKQKGKKGSPPRDAEFLSVVLADVARAYEEERRKPDSYLREEMRKKIGGRFLLC